MSVLALTLSDTPVVDTRGRDIGTLENIVIDPQTGSMEDIVIQTESWDEGHGQTKQIKVNPQRVSAVGDRVVIESA